MRGVIAAAMLLAAGCFTQDDQAKRAAEAMGFRDVQTGGIDWFACGKGDMEGRKFTGVNANGQVVSGAVCCGFMLKGCTVRF